MSKRYLSLLLGITAIGTATLGSSEPVSAATMSCETGDLFDFDSIQYIETRPINSNNCLRLFGNREGANDPDPQGVVGYRVGHEELSLNAPPPPFNRAPYYVAGMDFSPENVPGARRAASLLDEITGFTNFANFLTDNEIDPDRIGFSFGPVDGDFNKSWNLGEDINGQNYFSSPNSSLEERIYAANPDEVSSFLLLDDTKIINFGYSDIYSFLEYGDSTESEDDLDAILSDPFDASKVEGLSGDFDGLANAFLADLGTDQIQLVSEDAGVTPDFVFTNPELGILNPVVSIRFPAQLRIVSVPEPSITFSLLGLSFLAVGSGLGNQNRSRH